MYPPQPPPFGQFPGHPPSPPPTYGQPPGQPPPYGSPRQAPPAAEHAYQQQYQPQQYARSQYEQAQTVFTPQVPVGPAAMPQVQPQAGAGLMPSLNPLSFMGTASLLSAPQAQMTAYMERMQARMGSLSGGTLSSLFNISRSYVLSKLLMLVAPFLKRWTYTRLHEQIAGGQKYRPPRADCNAPDLYLPLMAMWTYSLLACASSAMSAHTAKGSKPFNPEVVYASIWGATMAWGVHLLVARLLLRAMSLAGVPWLELTAFTGYPFVPICLATLVGLVLGQAAYFVVWMYGSLCMAIFLVRTVKRIIFQEAKHYNNLALTNYPLLVLAMFQFPYALWLGWWVCVPAK